MTTTEIDVDVSERIMTITLDRPDQLNAFTVTMMREVIGALDRADADDEAPFTAVIFTGAGRAFSAGADLAGAEAFDYESSGAAAAAESQRDSGEPTTEASEPMRSADEEAPRRWRHPHPPALQVPQAGDRHGERRGGRYRRHHDVADGHPSRCRFRQVRVRVQRPGHRARGVLELVPPPRRRHQHRVGVVLHRSSRSGVGGTRSGSGAEPPSGRRCARHGEGSRRGISGRAPPPGLGGAHTDDALADVG